MGEEGIEPPSIATRPALNLVSVFHHGSPKKLFIKQISFVSSSTNWSIETPEKNLPKTQPVFW